MLKTLRKRLVLSHILPILIVIPFMGMAIVYVIETQYLLPSLSRELEWDTRLLAEFARDQTGIFDNSRNAQAFLNRIALNPGKRIMLLSPDAHLLASSDPADADRVDQQIEVGGIEQIQKGELVDQIVYSQRLSGQIIDVFVPVMNEAQSMEGIIRTSYRFSTIEDELLRLRYLITGILAIGLLSGTSLGLLLAVNISSPIRQVAQAIYDVASGNRREKLEERGPDELRLLLNAVNHLVERLRHLEQSRRQFLANLVHELGRPLGALRMAIHAAKHGAQADPQFLNELLIGMDEESVRLQRLLEDLAHLHDQVLGPLELDRQPVALSEWLHTVLLSWKEAALEKRLKWEQRIPSDLPTISADPVRLGQIVGNLTSNAIKYTPAGGTVSITAGTQDDEIFISVRDTGPGITPEEQEKIFTPFYRGTQSDRIKQGMGLGLTIARDLVAAHEGRLELESAPGLGTQFTIWLPTRQRPMIPSG
ncbi:MAG TPA: HAMP domain-containing sensor histidine kinase [Anaerolineales bacterium]